MVTEVIDCWLSPDHRYFKIRGSDTGEYIIRHDTMRQVWELTAFKAGTSGEPSTTK